MTPSSRTSPDTPFGSGAVLERRSIERRTLGAMVQEGELPYPLLLLMQPMSLINSQSRANGGFVGCIGGMR